MWSIVMVNCYKVVKKRSLSSALRTQKTLNLHLVVAGLPGKLARATLVQRDLARCSRCLCVEIGLETRPNGRPERGDGG